MTFPVKYLRSAMRGAPVLSGTAGALIALLDACLITGFGQVTLTSLVVSGGVATATVGAGDTFEEGAVILVDGATPAALNGEQRVLSSTSTTFTFATTAPDGAATGSITAKYAAVGGWEKTYSGTNKAVYRSTDTAGNRHYLRVDDNGTGSAAYARVIGYESMTDVDAGTGPFPTNSLMSGGGYWHKSTAASSTAANWRVFGDSRMVGLAIAGGIAGFGASGYAAPAMGFGDAIPLTTSGDGYLSVLACAPSNYGSIADGSLESVSPSTPTIFAPRIFGGTGGAIRLANRVYGGINSSSLRSGDVTFAQGGQGDFPSAVDGRLLLQPMVVSDGGGAAKDMPRGIVPGIYFAPHSKVKDTFNDGDTFVGVGELSERTLVAIGTSSGFNYTSPAGRYFVDTTGPWR